MKITEARDLNEASYLAMLHITARATSSEQPEKRESQINEFFAIFSKTLLTEKKAWRYFRAETGGGRPSYFAVIAPEILATDASPSLGEDAALFFDDRLRRVDVASKEARVLLEALRRRPTRHLRVV